MAEAAARDACYAAFRAAHALLIERDGKSPKKHGTVHRAFDERTRADASIDQDLRRFLPSAYEFKRISDYGVDRTKGVTLVQAEYAVSEARRFVAAVKSLLP